MEIGKARTIESVNSSRGVYGLLSLSHSGFSQEWNLINNSEEVIYEGREYLPFNFEVVLGNKEDSVGASLVLANIDRRIQQEMDRAISVAPNESIIIRYTQVTIGNNDMYEKQIDLFAKEAVFTLEEMTISKKILSAGLTVKNSFSYNLGKYSYNPVDFMNINV